MHFCIRHRLTKLHSRPPNTDGNVTDTTYSAENHLPDYALDFESMAAFDRPSNPEDSRTGVYMEASERPSNAYKARPSTRQPKHGIGEGLIYCYRLGVSAPYERQKQNTKRLAQTRNTN